MRWSAATPSAHSVTKTLERTAIPDHCHPRKEPT